MRAGATIEALGRRFQMMVGRAILSAVKDDSGIQQVQVELLADEVQDEVEHFQPYGLTAHPLAGAEGVALSVGGLRSHAIVVAVGDRRYRLTGLAAGEVALHDDQGQKVHLTRDGIVISSAQGISMSTDGDMTFDADRMTMTAGAITLASDDVKIGNGASLGAARKTDAASGGTITGGSTKVKIA